MKKYYPSGVHTYYTTNDTAIECEFEYSPAERGSREHGVQMEPDYPPFIELCSAKVGGMEILDLINEETQLAIEEEILDTLDNPEYDGPDDTDRYGDEV